MGIDVYLRWDGQTTAEREAQYTGFSVIHGHVGYLREAYHGGPYATQVLITEPCDEPTPIPAATLRERLPAALVACEERCRRLYPQSSDEEIRAVQASFTAFVELAERKEREQGHPVSIYVSG